MGGRLCIRCTVVTMSGELNSAHLQCLGACVPNSEL